MDTISDDLLIDELKKRLANNRKALSDLRMLTKKLETLNTKLAESEAVKGNFLSNIRNEINNPLASIMGLSKQVFSGKADAETAKLMAQTIHNEAFDLDFQLRNIFTAAELEAGESTLSIARVDIDSLILSLFDSYEHRAMEKNVRLELRWNSLRPNGDNFYFTTDSAKLEIILSNLIANAIEFNKEGKSVTVSVGKEDGELTIRIEDEGIGITAEQRESLFTRFRQFDSGTQKAHRGHGLGLSITKALVELLNGGITFASSSSGGCIFTVAVKEAAGGEESDTISEEGNEFLF